MFDAYRINKYGGIYDFEIGGEERESWGDMPGRGCPGNDIDFIYFMLLPPSKLIPHTRENWYLIRGGMSPSWPHGDNLWSRAKDWRVYRKYLMHFFRKWERRKNLLILSASATRIPALRFQSWQICYDASARYLELSELRTSVLQDACLFMTLQCQYSFPASRN